MLATVLYCSCGKTTTVTMPQAPITMQVYGKLSDGSEVKIFTLTNKNGVVAKVTEYGAILVSVEVPDKNGKVAGVVLTVGGVFGIGDKLVAVPWQQIKVSAGDEPTLRIAMSKEQLEAAPYFEPAKADSKASGMKSETQQR